jgi:hypothetical protein
MASSLYLIHPGVVVMPAKEGIDFPRVPLFVIPAKAGIPRLTVLGDSPGCRPEAKYAINHTPI